jgi:DNA repair protein RecN (Recombination protein N)
MLKSLSIRNFALIDAADIHFGNGLNILTGETGAGKSLLMGALDLLLGARADNSRMADANQKCIIEGSFDFPSSEACTDFFKVNDLDFDDTIRIRRELLPNGKSRAFINDTPVSLTQLKDLSHQLVDLHQQFDTLDLADESFQRSILDAMADAGSILSSYTDCYRRWSEAKHALTSLMQQQQMDLQQQDYRLFLYNELNELNLQPDELESAAAELKFLEQAESLKNQLSSIYIPLSQDEQALNIQLKVLIQKLNSIRIPGKPMEEIESRMRSAWVELKDIADELEQIDQHLSLDPARLDTLQERLNLGYKLLKKHQVQTTADLLSIQANLEAFLTQFNDLGKQIDALTQERNQLEKSCQELADQLSALRNVPVSSFSKKVTTLLKQVGMPQARLQVVLEKTALQSHGQDLIQFLFDGNHSDKWQPIGKVASGGELSRLMLVIKSIVAQKIELPTLIFDEIDSGISGEATRQVGIILQELSRHHQIIVITHQPPIAAKANQHFLVYKSSGDQGWKTSLRQLNDAERLEALAQMLDGQTPSDAARAHASALMAND